MTTFLTLPVEIRLHIYDYLLKPKHVYFLDATGCRDHLNWPKHRVHPEILRINSLIAAEAYSVLYTENTFHFLYNVRLTPRFMSIRTTRLLKRVTIGPMQCDAKAAALGMRTSIHFIGRACPRLHTLGVQCWFAQYMERSIQNNSIIVLLDGLGAIGTNHSLKRMIMGMNQGVTEMELSVLDLTTLKDGRERKESIENWIKVTVEVLRKTGQIGGYVMGYRLDMLEDVAERIRVDPRLSKTWVELAQAKNDGLESSG
ncbi:MAG: hypothetical protein M1827_003660 [Pycnora praestabilis]|nr:MAG: hypothetical protein M1827_003660 [Pycnora praestabilis]